MIQTKTYEQVVYVVDGEYRVYNSTHKGGWESYRREFLRGRDVEVLERGPADRQRIFRSDTGTEAATGTAAQKSTTE